MPQYHSAARQMPMYRCSTHVRTYIPTSSTTSSIEAACPSPGQHCRHTTCSATAWASQCPAHTHTLLLQQRPRQAARWCMCKAGCPCPASSQHCGRAAVHQHALHSAQPKRQPAAATYADVPREAAGGAGDHRRDVAALLIDQADHLCQQAFQLSLALRLAYAARCSAGEQACGER